MSGYGSLIVPAALALLLSLPGAGLASVFGRRGIAAGLAGLAASIVGSLWVSAHVRDDEFAALVGFCALMVAILAPIPVVLGWHLGEAVRGRRAARARLQH